MRLSQLARKLEISPSELILFFKKNEIGRYNSHNNKIEENDLNLALNHYRPAEMEMDHDEQAEPEIGSTIDIPNPPSGPDPKITVEEAAELGSDVDKEVEEIEVISMPKIKLEGVKVVGKIDLPEPVKKVKEEEEPEVEDRSKLSRSISPGGHHSENRNTRKRSSRQKNKNRHARRELSYEEKLKREESKKTKEQQRAKRIKKQQKKQHYIKNIQSGIPPARKKKKNNKTEDRVLEPIKARPEYRNPVRKLWAWLNGEYD